MGMNTIALLNEACHDDWPAEIREAALCGQDPGPAGFSVNFSYGRILARAPEGACVMVSVRGLALGFHCPRPVIQLKCALQTVVS